MKKIHNLIIESNEKSIENIIPCLIKLLPKYFYVTNNILYYNKNTNGKCTIIFQCLIIINIIIIKIYKIVTNRKLFSFR